LCGVGAADVIVRSVEGVREFRRDVVSSLQGGLYRLPKRLSMANQSPWARRSSGRTNPLLMQRSTVETCVSLVARGAHHQRSHFAHLRCLL